MMQFIKKEYILWLKNMKSIRGSAIQIHLNQNQTQQEENDDKN